MQRIPKVKYAKEFREEAVKLVTEGGMSLPEADRRFSLPPSTTGNWIRAYKAGKLGDAGKLPIEVNGAGGENRTPTGLPQPDFESGASACSTTPAQSAGTYRYIVYKIFGLLWPA